MSIICKWLAWACSKLGAAFQAVASLSIPWFIIREDECRGPEADATPIYKYRHYSSVRKPGSTWISFKGEMRLVRDPEPPAKEWHKNFKEYVPGLACEMHMEPMDKETRQKVLPETGSVAAGMGQLLCGFLTDGDQFRVHAGTATVYAVGAHHLAIMTAAHNFIDLTQDPDGSCTENQAVRCKFLFERDGEDGDQFEMDVTDVVVHPQYLTDQAFNGGTDIALAKVQLSRSKEENRPELEERLQRIQLPGAEACQPPPGGRAALDVAGYPVKMLADALGNVGAHSSLDFNFNVQGMGGELLQEIDKDDGLRSAIYEGIQVTKGQGGGRVLLGARLAAQIRGEGDELCWYGIHAGQIRDSNRCIATVITQSMIDKWILPTLEEF